MSKDPMASPATAQEDDLDTRRFMGNVNARMSKIAIMNSLALIVLGVAFWVMIPLKRTVPYVVTVDSKSGEVSVASDRDVKQFDPTWVNASYFIRRWLKDLFTVNEYLTVKITDPRAQQFIRGSNAIAEYKAFRASDHTFDRLAADPSLIRNVEVSRLTQIAGTHNGAVAQVMLTTHEHGRTRVTTKLVTLYYLYVSSNNETTLRINPIGIYITDFKISSED